MALLCGSILATGAAAQERGAAVQAVAEHRIALVIGNSEYPNLPLANPANDGRLLAGTLREVGFEVLERYDADQREMKQAIRDFGAQLESAGKNAVGLFFFAGHGVQVRGENFLVPVGASIVREADVSIEAVSATGVLEQMSFAGNRLNLIILDACRNNPYKRSFRSAAAGLARMDAPTGSLVAYSTAPGTVAMDGEGDNSPYASALVHAIRQPGLRIEDVFKQTRRRVLEQTGQVQVPWESSSLLGDFYFRAAEPTQAEKAPPPTDMPPKESVPGVFRDCSGCPEMIEIPAGSFEMGSSRQEIGHKPNEAPTREVNVPKFALGRHEVTVAQYRNFVDRSGYVPAPGCWKWKLLWRFDQSANWRLPGFEQTDHDPVTCIRWTDALAYVEWLAITTGENYRLPTEAEWEYAARAGQKTSRPWGESPDLACGFANVYDQAAASQLRYLWKAHGCDDGHVLTAPVGSFKANRFGLFDMIGNVWEWVQDCAGPYGGAPADGSPAASGKCKKRVLRGGDNNEAPARVRSAMRHFDEPKDNALDYGFRVARSIDGAD